MRHGQPHLNGLQILYPPKYNGTQAITPPLHDTSNGKDTIFKSIGDAILQAQDHCGQQASFGKRGFCVSVYHHKNTGPIGRLSCARSQTTSPTKDAC